MEELTYGQVRVKSLLCVSLVIVCVREVNGRPTFEMCARHKIAYIRRFISQCKSIRFASKLGLLSVRVSKQ